MIARKPRKLVVHRRHPDIRYDVTIKVEHLLRDARHRAALADTGCLFVTTAVESFDDEVLRRLAKGHTAADFGRALGLLRQHGLAVHPTFIPFHPWTTPRDYGAFLERIADYDLVASVAPSTRPPPLGAGRVAPPRSTRDGRRARPV